MNIGHVLFLLHIGGGLYARNYRGIGTYIQVLRRRWTCHWGLEARDSATQVHLDHLHIDRVGVPEVTARSRHGLGHAVLRLDLRGQHRLARA